MLKTTVSPVQTKKHERAPLSLRRKLTVLGHWVGSLTPAAAVVLSAVFLFRQAVVSSIASTPHPELVFAILGAFFIGVLLTCVTLYRYTIEGNLVSRWGQVHPSRRKHLIAQLRWHSYLLPMYQIMLGDRPLNSGTRQAVVEQEIAAVNERFNDRLSLPQYLSGALVGLGLVGTFVGLLGTLEDLGKLFGALVQTGNANANPVEVFSDMVRRLQDPMRGMGTAFVASLYGLLGSLVLGLQILAVGKIGHGLINQVHVLVRRAEILEQDVSGDDKTFAVGTHPLELQIVKQALLTTQKAHQEQSKQWQELNTLLRLQQEILQKETHGLRREVLSIIQSTKALASEVVKKTSEVSQEALIDQSRRNDALHELIQLHQDQSHHETQLLRREIVNVTESTHALIAAVRESIKAEDRYRQSVPRTSYWQDAWVKVQAYLQRSHTDQSIADLYRITSTQHHTLSEIANTLHRIDQRLSAHLIAQFSDVTE
jgi:hypothetical protein